jgi:hypothetical protein
MHGAEGVHRVALLAEYVAALTAKASDKDRDDMAFDSFVEPAALILSSFIEKNLTNYRDGMIHFLFVCMFVWPSL